MQHFFFKLQRYVRLQQKRYDTGMDGIQSNSWPGANKSAVFVINLAFAQITTNCSHTSKRLKESHAERFANGHLVPNTRLPRPGDYPRLFLCHV